MAKKVAKMDANFWANKKRKSVPHSVGRSIRLVNHIEGKEDDFNDGYDRPRCI